LFQQLLIIANSKPRQLLAAMENASLLSDVENNVTTNSSEDDDSKQYSDNAGDFALQIINVVVGTIGVVDNLFVIVVFALFINIADKVGIR